MSKQRVLVMNGSHLLEEERGGQWAVQKVGKAGALKPGIYNLYLAIPADRSKVHEGVIVHADKDSVYQQAGKAYVKHVRDAFDTLPGIGSVASIQYHGNKAVVSATTMKAGRRIS